MFITDEKVPCSDEPGRWFSTEATNLAYAKAGCQRCPFILRCLEDTLVTEQLMGESLVGIHGGLTAQQRTKTILKRIA